MNKIQSARVPEFPDAELPDHAARLADPDRLKALDETGVMDSPAEDMFDRTVRLATNLLGVPVGLASFVDEKRQYFKAQCGVTDDPDNNRETPLSHSFCQYVVAHDMTLAVRDAREHPILSKNGAVADMGVVAYLGVPIHAPTGEPIGSFCAIDVQPRDWSERDVSTLSDLASIVETELALRHERDAMQTLARELNHRVKNLFSVVSGMVALTARTAETPADMAQVLQGRMSALDAAHQMISPAIARGDIEASSTDLAAMIERLLQPHLLRGPDQAEVSVPDLQLTGRSVTDLALVIHELATNAAKYGALSTPDGTLHITGAVVGDEVRLVWREEGGPSIDAVPTETGFGSKLIEITVERQMNGTLETIWHGDGVECILTVPRSVFDTGDDTPAPIVL